MTPHPDSLRIARTFAAPPARLYRAWTDAAEMARWYSPGEEMTLTIDALDVRVVPSSSSPTRVTAPETTPPAGARRWTIWHRRWGPPSGNGTGVSRHRLWIDTVRCPGDEATALADPSEPGGGRSPVVALVSA